MNKYKKIAIMVVSFVMAGTMVASLAACDPVAGGDGDYGERDKEVPVTRFNATADELKTITVGGQQLSVRKSDEGKLGYPSGTGINVNIVDSGNSDRKISYDAGQIATYWTAVDGYTYSADDLKPAWWQLGQDLGIKFADVAKTGRSGTEISKAISEDKSLAGYTLINGSITEITTYMTQFLNLADYLDYMPNFKNFLSEYEIVEWSLQMDNNGGMYYIPYFDGNDDIEKYELVQRNWVRTLLDEELPATDTSISYLEHYKGKNGNASSVNVAIEPFMGTTGTWSVETTKINNVDETGTLVVSYADVISALKDANSALYKAVVDAGVATPQSASGNIISIQNEIINNNNSVKGSALVKVLREYIKVAYKLDGQPYSKLSDVFLSASAGWDADLMSALFRCVVTNYKSFDGLSGAAPSEIYALAGRQNTPQRENDLIALAGELYGVRGLESRLEYLYVDANGNLQDARLNEDSYNAAAKLNALAKEGLLYSETLTAKSVVKTYESGKITTFMLHDYVQTQTQDGFKSSKFDLAPIVTPVSKWDDGKGEKYMRFTESWRSVKNGGVVIPLEAVSGKPHVLSAVLSFVDYLFSNDGQIIGSYGPMSTNGNGADANGFWYGNDGVEVLDASGNLKAEYNGKVKTVDGEQYFLDPAYRGEGFMYRNVLYKGMQYKPNKQIPFMTQNNTDFYLGKEVNGCKMSTTNQLGYKKSHVGNYTDYARGVVGAALPIGNKDQGFEYQCTAACGLDGASIVSKALANGSIKHVVQEIDQNNWWYTVVPSVLPVPSGVSTVIGAGNDTLNGTKDKGAIYNATGGTSVSNVYIDLAFYGYDTSIIIGTGGLKTGDGTHLTADATSLINAIKALGVVASSSDKRGYLEYRVDAYKDAWTSLKSNKLK